MVSLKNTILLDSCFYWSMSVFFLVHGEYYTQFDGGVLFVQCSSLNHFT